jgi:glutamine synthetase
MSSAASPGTPLSEATEFLSKNPDVQGSDVVMTDCHAIGRGKIIRRHELESLSINLSDKFSGINKSVWTSLCHQ